VLPLTTEVVELKLKEYNYMFVGAFDVLLARREASEADLAYVKTVGEYWQARAELDAALGGGTDMAPVMAAGEPE
jgi:cobalt-zinc-cadmium efflux system outer membrane protein